MKKIHYISGSILATFIIIHLINHIYSVVGAAAHIKMMSDLRVLYRNIIVETIVLSAVVVQIISGIRLFAKKRKKGTNFFEKIQLWSGGYLAFFLIIHLSAVLTGRFVMNLDTNFYFGAAGLNTFPLNLFFVPYYFFAIISFFGHISAIYSKKMKRQLMGVKPIMQSYSILFFGILVALFTLYGLTNKCRGVPIPKEYHILIGK